MAYSNDTAALNGIRKAAKMIKEYCKEQQSCKNCVLRNSTGVCSIPENWLIKDQDQEGT